VATSRYGKIASAKAEAAMLTSILGPILVFGSLSGDEILSLLHLDRYGDTLPFGAVARLGNSQWASHELDKHPPIMFVAAGFSPDGETLALLKTDRTLRFLDATTGKEKKRLRLESEAYSMVFTPDGKTLFTGNGQAWDVKTGKESFRLEGIKKIRPTVPYWLDARVIVCAPDGKSIAAAEPESVRIWDATAGKKVQASKTVLKRVRGIAFSPDGKKIALSGSKEDKGFPTSVSLIIFDSEKLEESASFDVKDAGLASIVFSPDGKRIYTSGAGENLHVFDLMKRKEAAPIPAGKGPNLGLGWDEKNNAFASLGYDGELRFWDEEGREKGHLSLGGRYPTDFALSFVLSADGKSVAVMKFPLALTVLDRASGKQLFTLDENGDPISALAFSSDGKTIATGGLGSVLLWDATKGTELRKLEGFEGAVRGVAFTSGGDELSLLDHWNLSWVAVAKQAKSVKSSPTVGHPKGFALSPDGNAAIVVGLDRQPEIWDRGAERRPHFFSGQKEGRTGGRCVAISPDGKWVAVGSESDGRSFAAMEGLVTVWDLKSRKLLRQFGGDPRNPKNRISAIAFTPDSRFLAFAEGPEIVLCTVEKGVEVGRFPSADKDIVSVCFSPDGRLLASAGHDNAVRLYEVATTAEIRLFEGHRQEVTALAFSPDGRRLASGSTDTSCIVWDVYGAVSPWRPLSATLGEEQLDDLWKDLHGSSARNAYHAIAALARAPKQSLPFLKKKLKDYQPPDAKKMDQLFKDLLDEIPPACDQAYQELLEVDGVPEKSLRAALKDSPSDVLRKRLDRLLEYHEIGPPVFPTGQRLQILRALAVLELLATDDAKSILQSLAKGNPKDPVVREAKAALGRINR
jgi:WD40 repeat protein